MIVRVRNLRVAVAFVRDAVVIVILVLVVRRAVTIGVQLEVRLSVVLAAIRVGHRDRNIELLNGVLVQLRPVRERHRDLTGGLVNLDLIALRSLEVFRNRELRTRRSLRVLTVLASERRGRLGLLARNNKLVLILRLVKAGILLGHRDGDVNGVLRAIRVSHHNRNSDLVTRLRTLRNRNRDLTSIRINLHTLRRVGTRSELRALRSLSVLTVLVLELRSIDLDIATRLTRTILVTRLVLFRCLIGYKDGPCGDIVSARDYDNVEDIALLCIRGDVEGARRNLSFNALGLVELAGLDDLAGLIAPLNLRRQARQVAVELRGHRGARSGRLVGCVVVSRDRHRGVRHDGVVDVVQRVQVLEPDTIAPVDRQLVLTRDC